MNGDSSANSPTCRRMVRTLHDISEETPVVVLFRSLELIYLQNQQASSIEKLSALRRHSDQLVTVINTDTEFDKKRIAFYIT